VTGLQYSRARWYDPQVGRFISEDPIGFAGGDINLYGYVKNNPLGFRDPTGLACNPVLGAILGAQVGVAIGALSGAGIGALAGGFAGVIAGGGGGTFVAPGVGTIGGGLVGGTGGVAAGAIIGTAAGGIAGAGIGAYIGYSYCKGQPDICEKVEPTAKADPVPPPRATPVPQPQPAPTPPSSSRRNQWTCDAKCHVDNFSGVPDAPEFCFGTGSGPTESTACQAAMNVAQAASPPGTFTRHCRCTQCYQQ
jgi:hypothetical protein